MPQIVNFDGRNTIEPGAYAQIKSGVTQPNLTADSGIALIIDDGLGAGYGYGSGVNGTGFKGVKSIYSFVDLTDFKRAIGGGILWDLADYLFDPTNNGGGISKLYYVGAKTTTPAALSLTLGDTSTLQIKLKNEGLRGNGAILGSPNVKILHFAGVIVTGNTINCTVNGINFTQAFSTNSATTLGALATKMTGFGTFNLAITAAATGTNTLEITTSAAPLDSNIADGQQITATLTGLTLSPSQANYYIKIKDGNAGVMEVWADSGLSTPVTKSGSLSGSPHINFTITNPVVSAVVTGNDITITTTTACFITNISVTGGASQTTGVQNTTGNGYLTRGYGLNLTRGVLDSSKFIVNFYEGQFKGLDPDGNPYDIAELDISRNTQVAKSAEVVSLADFVTWATNSADFNNYFVLGTITPGGMFTSPDLTSFANIQTTSGGTESYGGQDFLDTLEAIAELDNSFILCCKYGDTAQGSNNTQLLNHINTQAIYKKQMYIGGGYDNNKFTGSNSSADIANYFNSQYVTVVHSGIEVPSSTGLTTINKPSIYHAALWLGREAGVEPQTSLTYKDIRIKGVVHELSKNEREFALQKGIGHVRNVNGTWLINQGINSLQNNQYLVNPDASSPEKSIVRIGLQLNKELILNGTSLFVGGNLNTSSAADVEAFLRGYLNSKIATQTQDNLIISWQKITIKLNQDRWEVKYQFVPNGPINRIYFTGFIIDANISINS